MDNEFIKCKLKKISDDIHENIKTINSKENRVDTIFNLYIVMMWLLGFGTDIAFNPSFNIFLRTVFAQVSGLIVALSYNNKLNKSIELHHKLCSYISIISDNLDNSFYEAYVIIDYLDKKKIETKEVKYLYEYLSQFNKNEPNSCFNEVGMKYNYSPVSENKLLEIKDKENSFSVNNENGFEVITDMRLVDKYLEQPLLLEDNQKVYESSINNLELKPSVFDKNKKKINKENNGYTYIEISIGKIKILTIDKCK